MTQRPTVRRNGIRASVTVWGRSDTADTARDALTATLSADERAVLVQRVGQTFRYVITTA